MLIACRLFLTRKNGFGRHLIDRVREPCGDEGADASSSAQIEIVEFRSGSDGVRGVSQPTGRSRGR